MNILWCDTETNITCTCLCTCVCVCVCVCMSMYDVCVCFFLWNKYTIQLTVTHAMDWSPHETDRFSARQQISHISWNPECCYFVHKSPPSVPVLSQISPVCVLLSYFFKTDVDIALTYACIV